MTFPRIVLALCATLLLGACVTDPIRERLASTPPNVSLEGSPNTTQIGPVDPQVARIRVPLGGRAIVAAFRAKGCGEPAPNFARLMREQAADGLQVPDGITLYDAGIGVYKSSRCNAKVPSRAIGVYGNKQGRYELRFFGGKANRTVTVK